MLERPTAAARRDQIIGSIGDDWLSGGAGEDPLIGEDQLLDAARHRLYRATHDRDNEITSLLVWADCLIHSELLSEVAVGIVNSMEFRHTHGQNDDTSLVTLLYANVRERTTDATGLVSWTGLLASGAQPRVHHCHRRPADRLDPKPWSR